MVPKKNKKPAIVNVQKAAVNDKKAPVAKPPARNASAVAKGAIYHVLAGRPSRPAVVACFGKTGYALSWVARAARMGIPTEQLCEQFKANPEQVKAQWAALQAAE
jgi:hypothetical protein